MRWDLILFYKKILSGTTAVQEELQVDCSYNVDCVVCSHT